MWLAVECVDPYTIHLISECWKTLVLNSGISFNVVYYSSLISVCKSDEHILSVNIFFSGNKKAQEIDIFIPYSCALC